MHVYIEPAQFSHLIPTKCRLVSRCNVFSESKYSITIFLYGREMTSTTCAVSSVQLKIKDLSTVQDALTPVAHKFLVFGSRVAHQRSDTMYSRTVFPGVRNSVVRLL